MRQEAKRAEIQQYGDYRLKWNYKSGDMFFPVNFNRTTNSDKLVMVKSRFCKKSSGFLCLAALVIQITCSYIYSRV